MKFISLILLTLTVGFSASAATYNCDGTDLISGKTIMGSSESVEISADGTTAQVFITGVYPGAKKSPKTALKLSSGLSYAKLFSSDQSVQDLTVSFKLSPQGKAGILKTVGMPQYGGDSNVNMNLCEQE